VANKLPKFIDEHDETVPPMIYQPSLVVEVVDARNDGEVDVRIGGQLIVGGLVPIRKYFNAINALQYLLDHPADAIAHERARQVLARVKATNL